MHERAAPKGPHLAGDPPDGDPFFSTFCTYEPACNVPFHGDFKGCTWNAQALFAANIYRQSPKMTKAIHLASNHNFVILTETHSLEGRSRARSLPSHLTALWSHNSASVGGVGIILHRDFLKLFNPVVSKRDWLEIIPGTLAILQLRGPLGSLDIVCAYFPTGDSSCEARRQSVSRDIGRHIKSSRCVLSILSGDFNFVEHEQDRICIASGAWTGLKDRNEAEVFQQSVLVPHDLFEWEQNHLTCEAGGARSRIDRMYCNQHLSFQLNRHISCNVLEWDRHTSVHRPLSFSRTTPAPKKLENKPIPLSEFKREGWVQKVFANFQYLSNGDPMINNPARRLLLLKDAIRNSYELNVEDMGGFAQKATSPDDRLGFTLSCLRAMERGQHDRVFKCAQAYPKFMEWIPREVNQQDMATRVNNIREHAVELARTQIEHEIHSINTGSFEEPEDRDRAKTSVLQKLKRLSPGESTGIGAMQDNEGRIVTRPEEIASILKGHWQGVFSEKKVRDMALQIWMEELFIKSEEGCFITGLPSQGDRCWNITKGTIRKAIKQSKNSMPGPDGIPSAAYRQLGDLAVDILYDLATALSTCNSKEVLREAYSDRCQFGAHDFNLSLLCCLPKKPTGTDDVAGDYFKGEDTRPLALVNTDNRIVASAARLTWEPVLNNYISLAQQGFLKGRQMLNNIIDVDYEAMKVSLKCKKGWMVLFDFKAAFPSVAHSFLINSLGAIGLPEHALNFIRSLYHHNRCNISFQGQSYEGFDMLCGVRQGCPISPLLFAAAVDVLLRILQKRVPGGIFRAFADDIGGVLEDWDRDQPIIEQVFKEFAGMSGLELNIKKTVLIPLWETGDSDMRRFLSDSGSQWGNMSIENSGTYLGFVVGPGRGDRAWAKPVQKFLRRCHSWGNLGLGLSFGTLAYNTFAASTLAFIAQLHAPSAAVYQAEAQGIPKFLPGPHQWCTNGDAFYLKESWGQNFSFKCMEHTASAAKTRVKYMHDKNRRSGNNLNPSSIRQMAGLVRDPHSCCEYPNRLALWRVWYESCFARTLQENEESLRNRGFQVEEALSAIAGGGAPWTRRQEHKQKSSIQKYTTNWIKKKEAPDPHNRLREKIHRWCECYGNHLGWGLAGPPARIATRIIRHLQELPQLVAPKVRAAMFRTLFNGWCTERRFQRRWGPKNTCMLGCGGGAEDSIEHYCRCPCILHVLKSTLHVSIPPSRAFSFFLMCDYHCDIRDNLISGVLMNYASYMATNLFRNTGIPTSRDVAVDALVQYIKQGAISHRTSASFFNQRWATPIYYIDAGN